MRNLLESAGLHLLSWDDCRRYPAVEAQLRADYGDELFDTPAYLLPVPPRIVPVATAATAMIPAQALAAVVPVTPPVAPCIPRSLTNAQRAVPVSKQLRRIERRRRELAARKIAAMSLREQWDLACAIGAAQFRLRQRATVEA
jgi:hypothetical protein